MSGQVPKDGRKSHIVVNKTAARGVPPKDARFTNLDAKQNCGFGQVAKDLSVTNLAVHDAICGAITGNSPNDIGRI